MWNKLRYKYAKLIYTLFYWEWDRRFAYSPELCQEFLTTFKVYRFQEPVKVSDIAKEYAMKWNRSSSEKTLENLEILIEEAIYEGINNADISCK